MAEKVNDKPSGAGAVVASDRMAAARAGRHAGKQSTDHLSDDQRYAIREIQGARSALTRCQKKIMQGGQVSGQLLQQCAQVRAAAADALFGNR